MKLWDAETLAEVRTLASVEKGTLNKVAFAPALRGLSGVWNPRSQETPATKSESPELGNSGYEVEIPGVGKLRLPRRAGQQKG